MGVGNVRQLTENDYADKEGSVGVGNVRQLTESDCVLTQRAVWVWAMLDS